MEKTKRSNGFSQKGEPIPVANQVLNTFTNSDIIENLPDFTDFTKVETNDFTNVQSPKVNPFTLIANLEKEKTSGKKEKAERQPSPTYAAFSVFCQTFESLSGAAYPTDQNGHYIMMPKDAGQMVYLMRYIDKIDRQGDSIEALKVFIQAAWNFKNCLPKEWQSFKINKNNQL
jgi:hypothetical protein